MTPEDIVPTSVLARLLDLSEARIRELTRAGKLPTAGRGRYAVGEAVSAYCRGLREAAAGRGGPDAAADLSLERALLARAQRARLEREAEAAAGRLVPADRVYAEAFKTGRIVRDALLAVPDRLAAELAAENDATVVHFRLSTEIRVGLREALKLLQEPPPEAGAPDGGKDAR